MACVAAACTITACHDDGPTPLGSGNDAADTSPDGNGGGGGRAGGSAGTGGVGDAGSLGTSGAEDAGSVGTGGAADADGSMGGTTGGSSGAGGSAGASGGGAGSAGATGGGAGSAGASGAGGGGGCASRETSAGDDLAAAPGEFSVLLLLDESASMTEEAETGAGVSRWQLVTRGLTEALQNSAPPEIWWGLKAFPGTEAQQCVGVSSAVEVPVAAANANVIAALLARRSPTGKNTPTGEAVKAADQYLAQQSGAGPKFILLVTDGEPNCPANPPGVPYAVQTIGEAFARGFRTFVVGISATTDPINASLNQMAIAGGASTTSSNARAAAPVPHYYPASNPAELAAALATIMTQITGCVAR
jgi:hypothetical protein